MFDNFYYAVICCVRVFNQIRIASPYSVANIYVTRISFKWLNNDYNCVIYNGINPLWKFETPSIFYMFLVCSPAHISDLHDRKCTKSWVTCTFSVMMHAHLQFSSIIFPPGIAIQNHTCATASSLSNKNSTNCWRWFTTHSPQIPSMALRFTSAVCFFGGAVGGVGVGWGVNKITGIENFS